MCVGCLPPFGLMHTWPSVEHRYWFARSFEFLDNPVMQTFRWMPVPGDTVFAIGAVALGAFVFTHRGKNQSDLRSDAVPATGCD